MLTKRYLLNFAVTAFVAVLPIPAALIGVTPTNTIQIDPSTGAGTLIGPSGLTTTLSLARDSAGNLYTTTTAAVANLATINPITGAGTLGPAITGTGLSFYGASGLAFSPLTGVLFASINNPNVGTPESLYTINTSTGAATLIGTNIDGHLVSDIAFSMAGVLFGWDNDIGGLIVINTTTGVGTLVNSSGGPDIRALTFDSSGNLLGGGTNLYRIDTTTGATTLIGALGLTDFTRGMAFTATPEPSTAWLVIVSAAVLCTMRLRKLRSTSPSEYRYSHSKS